MGEIDRWANIDPDLLDEISKRVYMYEDYVRLRVVCKEWHSKIPPKIRNLWLVLPGVIRTSETRKIQEDEIYPLILPEMQDNHLLRGSCYGWLIYVMVSDGILRMLNPFNKAHFDLPPLSTFPDVVRFNPDSDQYILRDFRADSDDEDSRFRFPRIGRHKYEVWKVVISSPPDDGDDDFMAVVLYGECGRLAFYKRNDTRWTDIDTGKKEPDFQDVIFFQEKIYAIDWEAHLYEFDAKTKPSPKGGICEAVSPPAFHSQVCHVSMNKYLIGCEDGSLLLLVRYFDSDGGGTTCGFDIFKLDKDAKEWSKIDSLGAYTIMIGYNSSVQMLAHTFPGCMPNHIYYTDNLAERHCPCVAQCQDIGIFNLEDRSIKKLLLDVKFSCPPVWLLPW